MIDGRRRSKEWNGVSGTYVSGDGGRPLIDTHVTWVIGQGAGVVTRSARREPVTGTVPSEEIENPHLAVASTEFTKHEPRPTDQWRFSRRVV